MREASHDGGDGNLRLRRARRGSGPPAATGSPVRAPRRSPARERSTVLFVPPLPRRSPSRSSSPPARVAPRPPRRPPSRPRSSPPRSPATDGVVIHASWTQALPPRCPVRQPAGARRHGGRPGADAGSRAGDLPGPARGTLRRAADQLEGHRRLLQAAKDAGILGPGTDFTGGAMPMGAAAARLQIVVDGVTHDLVGDANAAVPCPPTQTCPEAVPGTPAAFARFWYRLLDMAGWLETELGPEQAARAGVLRGHRRAAAGALGRAPPPSSGPRRILPWAPSARPCAASPEPAAGSRPATSPPRSTALRPGDRLTPFVATASASSTRGLTVRALLPGDEDPCAPIVE